MNASLFGRNVQDSSKLDNTESGLLGKRVDQYLTPWDEIDTRDKKRFSGIAKLICEAAASGDLSTAKEYWRKARFENPDVANSVFYDNFSRRISSSYIEFANRRMNEMMYEIPILGFQELEIAISNAQHYDSFHPMIALSEARLLIRKANNLGRYDAGSCLERAQSKIAEAYEIDHSILVNYSIDDAAFTPEYNICLEEYEHISQIINKLRSAKTENEGIEWLLMIGGVILIVVGIGADSAACVLPGLAALLVGMWQQSLSENLDTLLINDSHS